MKTIIKRCLFMMLLVSFTASVFAAKIINSQYDFYTPMSMMVISDRDYLLTSNAYEWIDMGAGAESYETLTFIKFNDNKLPDAVCERVWLRLASGAGGSMGDTTKAIYVSVQAACEDVQKILSGEISPRDFYVNNDNLLDSADSIYVYKDGVCYWDITDIVNSWILYKQTSGAEGFANNGLAITGRDDPGASNPDDNEHTGFWSSRAITGSSPMPYAVAPAMIFTLAKSYFDIPWMPDWSQQEGFTFQFWTLSASQGKIEQPLSPDGYVWNTYGEPNAVWEEETHISGQETINPFLTWHPFAASDINGSQPDWIDGVYGGVYRGSAYAPHKFTANIPITQAPNTKVIVQYDWYDGGSVEASINGASDITPEAIKNFKIDEAGSGNWYRSTRIFELPQGLNAIEVVLTVSGYEPYINLLSVMTASTAVIPQGDIRFEQDINADGRIDLFEFAAVANRWNEGNADYSDIFELADIWLDESEYVWKF